MFSLSPKKTPDSFEWIQANWVILISIIYAWYSDKINIVSGSNKKQVEKSVKIVFLASMYWIKKNYRKIIFHDNSAF